MIIIQHAVWLYHRFPLSYRDVQELLHQRSTQVSIVVSGRNGPIRVSVHDDTPLRTPLLHKTLREW